MPDAKLDPETPTCRAIPPGEGACLSCAGTGPDAVSVGAIDATMTFGSAPVRLDRHGEAGATAGPLFLAHSAAGAVRYHVVTACVGDSAGSRGLETYKGD